LTALDHGYVPEEHAPDPVISHGDPTRPGKVGIWLFLASEVMFFIGILGTYIIYRSGAPELFSRHGATLSKPLAALNTIVLIFSSLTMALAVDAAQKGDRGKVVRGLLLTLLCAAVFMGVKAVEYSEKFHHYTIVAAADAPVTVTATAEPGQTLYAAVTSPTRQVFNVTTGSFEPSSGFSSQRKRGQYVIPLKTSGDGTYTGIVPAGAAGPNVITVYNQGQSAEPTPKDKPLKDAKADYAGGVFVFDGHVHDEGTHYAFTGWQAPYPMSGTGIDINLVSGPDVQAMPGARENKQPLNIDKARINAETSYGPWKNNFFASYFTLTGVHGLHVVGGMIPLTILLLQSLRGRIFPHHTEYVGLYWHFVDLVWIFLFPLLYLI
jgi:cytochrome c oxidase subunit III